MQLLLGLFLQFAKIAHGQSNLVLYMADGLIGLAGEAGGAEVGRSDEYDGVEAGCAEENQDQQLHVAHAFGEQVHAILQQARAAVSAGDRLTQGQIGKFAVIPELPGRH
jgi:hypothetical protein